MYVKSIFCAAVLVIQTISAQYGCNQFFQAPPCSIQGPASRSRFTPYAASLTVSPYPLKEAPHIPAELLIASDGLLISGPIITAGKLPFSGTVALEGELPAYGTGSVQYGCGNLGVLTEIPYSGSGYGC